MRQKVEGVDSHQTLVMRRCQPPAMVATAVKDTSEQVQFNEYRSWAFEFVYHLMYFGKIALVSFSVVVRDNDH
jgi:hypothetical protein